MAFGKKRKDGGALRHIAGQRLKYATERDPVTGAESVIGRRGSVSITAGGKLKVVCGTEVFSAAADAVRAALLMSLEGAVLTGYDETAGRERTVVVYFQYYRKV